MSRWEKIREHAVGTKMISLFGRSIIVSRTVGMERSWHIGFVKYTGLNVVNSWGDMFWFQSKNWIENNCFNELQKNYYSALDSMVKTMDDTMIHLSRRASFHD